MAVFPWRAMSAISLISSYLIVSRQLEWSKLRFFGLFAGIWSLQAFIWFVWAVIAYPKLFSPLRGLPEPAGGAWLMGHWKRIREEPSGIPMRDWVNTIPNDGLIRYLGAFNQERLLVTSPKTLSEVLVTKNYDFQKPSTVRFGLGRILGVGVLLAEGDEHKLQRKNLMPAFAYRHIKDLYPSFWEKGREVVQALTRHVVAEASDQANFGDVEKARKSSVIEVGDWASRVTLDIIGLLGLGRDFGAIQNPNTELNQMVRMSISQDEALNTSPWGYLRSSALLKYRGLFKPNRQAQMLALLGVFLPDRVIAWLPVKRNNDINASAKFIRAACRDMIREKKEKLARKEPADHDILSVALESGGFTDEELVDQLMTFLAAGHETTASSMTWSVYMLAKHPEFQTRLRQEIREKLPPIESDREVNSVDIDRMPYLNAVCNEVLRYWAPVPLTLRDTATDTSIMGQKVPKGTKIVLAPWAINFEKALWGPDANEFNPERWMAKDPDDKRAAGGGAPSNYAFMSFLHGPRSCIGQTFAKAEFACLLASWIGRFEFSLKNLEELDEKNVEIRGAVTARPAKGMYVHATIVDGW
ncbi:cytochrome P450 [Xylariaceae sp. FL0662B]|nr:cytochrome P450 [Xylariaceae sp. FL0662B]